MKLLVQHLLLVPNLSSEILTLGCVHSLVATRGLIRFLVDIAQNLLRLIVFSPFLVKLATKAFDWCLLLALLVRSSEVVLEGFVVLLLERDVISVVGSSPWVTRLHFSFFRIFSLSHLLDDVAVLET